MWSVYDQDELSEELVRDLFDMYVRTYTEAGQPLWYTSPEQLRRYTCSFVLSELHGHVDAFILYTALPRVSKISLFGHSGTPASKTRVLDELVSLLERPGYVLEASGAVSWSLRKRGLRPFEGADMIAQLLDLDQVNRAASFEEQGIIMNPDYRFANKNTQVYTHVFVNRMTGSVPPTRKACLGRCAPEDGLGRMDSVDGRAFVYVFHDW